MIREFKEFISRGNVIDLATAVVIGAAFGKIVDSFVKDIIMPPIGLILGKVDFSNLFINLGAGDYNTLAEAQAAAAPTINYGNFLNQVISFVIVAFAIFLIIKQANRFRRASEPAAPTEKTCPHCIMMVPLAATKCAHCTSALTA
ncbi:MAG TPA: large conductance mechanosensitive channel protein MscL [Longimicrobiales bacterium]